MDETLGSLDAGKLADAIARYGKPARSHLAAAKRRYDHQRRRDVRHACPLRDSRRESSSALLVTGPLRRRSLPTNIVGRLHAAERFVHTCRAARSSSEFTATATKSRPRSERSRLPRRCEPAPAIRASSSRSRIRRTSGPAPTESTAAACTRSATPSPTATLQTFARAARTTWPTRRTSRASSHARSTTPKPMEQSKPGSTSSITAAATEAAWNARR